MQPTRTKTHTRAHGERNALIHIQTAAAGVAFAGLALKGRGSCSTLYLVALRINFRTSTHVRTRIHTSTYRHTHTVVRFVLRQFIKQNKLQSAWLLLLLLSLLNKLYIHFEICFACCCCYCFQFSVLAQCNGTHLSQLELIFSTLYYSGRSGCRLSSLSPFAISAAAASSFTASTCTPQTRAQTRTTT